MPINVICPSGHKLKVLDKMAGKSFRCPKCSQVTVVPELEKSDFVETSETDGEIQQLDARPWKLPDPESVFEESDLEIPVIKKQKKQKSPPPPTPPTSDSSEKSGRSGLPIQWLLLGGTVSIFVVVAAVYFGIMVGSSSKKELQQAAKSDPASQKAPSGAADSAEAASPPATIAETAEPPAKPIEKVVQKPAEKPIEQPLEKAAVEVPQKATTEQAVTEKKGSRKVSLNLRLPPPAKPAEVVAKAPVQPAVENPPVKKSVPKVKPRPEAPAVVEVVPVQPAQPARPRDIVQLPAPMQRVVLGGSGNYLIAFLPTTKQVAVMDVAAKKISKLIPVDDDDVQIAAGETKLVVLQRTTGVLTRYALSTMERELTIASEAYLGIAMGSSSEGPILAFGKTLDLLDLKTLKPNGTATLSGHAHGCSNMRASAYGNVFGCWREGSSPSGMAILELVGDKSQSFYEHNSYGAINPGPDGRVVYTGVGRFSPDCKPLTVRPGGYATRVLVPAATGPFYLSLALGGVAGARDNAPTRLTVHSQNDETPLFTATDVTIPDVPNNIHPAHVAHMGLDRRLFLLPSLNALVTVPQSLDQLIIHRFDMREELDNSGIDYFFIASIPPRGYTRGKKFTYPIEVISKRGNLQYTLSNNPPGMTLSAEGQLNWNVPANFADNDLVVLVNVRDAAGQELAHTIKLTEGQSSIQPSGGKPSVGKSTGAKPARPVVPAPATVPAPKEAPAKVLAAAPTAAGENRWQWSGTPPVCVRGEKGNLGGILVANKLYMVNPEGALSTDGIALSTTFTHLGLRTNEMIGVAANPTRVEMMDRKGKLLRKVLLENVAPTGLSLHPNKPICYVSLDHTVKQFRGTFVAVDEQAATVESGDEELGQDLVVDPTGRFLVSSYIQSVHVGDQVVVTQPRGAPIPRGIPRGRMPRGRVQPGRPMPAPQVGVRQTFAKVALLLVYDLDEPLQPAIHSVSPLTMPTGQMRISYDGRRVSTLAIDSKLTQYAAYNPLDLKAPPINYELTVRDGRAVSGSDIAYHPALPIGVVAGAGTISFVNVDDGKPFANKKPADIPDIAAMSLKRSMFSADGKHVVVLASGTAGDHSLVRINLSLTADEQKSMRERAAGSPKDLKESAPPLAELTALSGGEPKAMSTAEITASYADAVVIVRSGNSTGTGFFVGTSGLILTCAHCVSPLDDVEVVYHPKGKPDDKETIEATVIRRDRKRDLALLQIDVETPLHSVVLADPIDVKSGNDVTIIANPGLGAEVLDNTVTTGIISNAKRMIEQNDYIQSSAAVNPGSSGGPMFDRHGRVIGVVVLKAGIDGVGFAVPPLPIAQFLLKATRRDGAHGELIRDWLNSSSTPLEETRLTKIEKESVTLANKASGKTKSRPFTEFSPGDQKLLELLSTDE